MHADKDRVSPVAGPAPAAAARRAAVAQRAAVAADPARRRLADLQRSAGNQATAAWLRDSRTVQRRFEPYPTTYVWPAHAAAVKKDVEDFLVELDRAVQIAWLIVTSRPLDDTEQMDGYTKRWASEWALYQEKKSNQRSIAPLVPAMAGYAIESIATKLLLPKVWRSYTVGLQDPHGNTRPDVVLYDGAGTELGWFDLTADTATSRGHILKKSGGGWKSRPMVAEILYNQIRAADLEVSMETYEKAGKPSLMTYGAVHLENYWIERARFTAVMNQVEPVVRAVLDPLRGQGHSDTKMRDLIVEKLSVLRGEDLTNKEAASVIESLYGNYQQWGYRKAGGRYQGLVKMFATPVRAATGQGFLQEIAEHQGIVPSDNNIRDTLSTLRPDMLTQLQGQGRYL